jgi:ABC-type polysaccharide transport system permease subunit
MVLPGFLYFVINNYIPMFGIYIAFKKVDYSKGLWGSDWVGFENFKYLFSTSDAFIITRNTILYNVAFIVLGLLSGMIVGICLSEVYNKFFRKTYQTAILLPQLSSFVIVSYIVYALLSNETGMITKMMGGSVNFYAEKKYWPFILIFINIWKQLGYNGIVFLSSIVGIDYGMYEAARVDGASKWQQIFMRWICVLSRTVYLLMRMNLERTAIVFGKVIS